jgi:hypothetical protein
MEKRVLENVDPIKSPILLKSAKKVEKIVIRASLNPINPEHQPLLRFVAPLAEGSRGLCPEKGVWTETPTISVQILLHLKRDLT